MNFFYRFIKRYKTFSTCLFEEQIYSSVIIFLNHQDLMACLSRHNSSGHSKEKNQEGLSQGNVVAKNWEQHHRDNFSHDFPTLVLRHEYVHSPEEKFKLRLISHAFFSGLHLKHNYYNIKI